MLRVRHSACHFRNMHAEKNQDSKVLEKTGHTKSGIPTWALRGSHLGPMRVSLGPSEGLIRAFLHSLKAHIATP